MPASVRPLALLPGLALVLLAAGLAGCARPAPPRTPIPEVEPGFVAAVEPVNPWTHLRLAKDPAAFHFAILCDRTGGPRPGVFEEGVRKANLLAPAFVMGIGDLIEGKTEDEAQVDREWAEVVRILAGLQMPYFLLPGNHDVTNPMMAGKWQERFGRSYYHFTYRGTLFLVLNTEDTAKAHVSDEQVAYMARALAANRSAPWTMVFMHQPLWLAGTPTGWEKVEALLARRPYTVFAGHDHRYGFYKRKGRDYLKVAVTGGTRMLGGPAVGEIDQIVWVTMTSDGPRIANLVLEGILDKDFVKETGP